MLGDKGQRHERQDETGRITRRNQFDKLWQQPLALDRLHGYGSLRPVDRASIALRVG